YDIMDEIRKKYNLEIEVMFPEREAVEKMVKEKGFNLFYHSIENRKLCCYIRKVEPLKRILKTLDAWITGLRKEQAVTRQDIKKVEVDLSYGKHIKINPLADWKKSEVWDYIKKNNLPYNKLYDIGYAQIGCAPCTRAIKPGEDDRAGRWWWEKPEQKECGLHEKRK
ncbi:MAG: phosphoadenylyl-sulfate reductase, partial [bacterium]|nr:phosphoadenylyl-sulfate reductase [bacterium]